MESEQQGRAEGEPSRGHRAESLIGRPAASPETSEPAALSPEPFESLAAAEIESEEPLDRVGELPPSAALARLGPEGLLRLRARHAEVMARITDRVSDPARQEELKSKAERLNPDTWVTDEDVRLGLDAYEATFDELRAAVGRPRTRRRRRKPMAKNGSPAAGGVKNPEPAEPAGDESL